MSRPPLERQHDIEPPNNAANDLAASSVGAATAPGDGLSSQSPGAHQDSADGAKPDGTSRSDGAADCPQVDRPDYAGGGDSTHAADVADELMTPAGSDPGSIRGSKAGNRRGPTPQQGVQPPSESARKRLKDGTGQLQTTNSARQLTPPGAEETPGIAANWPEFGVRLPATSTKPSGGPTATQARGVSSHDGPPPDATGADAKLSPAPALSRVDRLQLAVDEAYCNLSAAGIGSGAVDENRLALALLWVREAWESR